MAKKAKMPTDVNARAARLVELATTEEQPPEKNTAKAVGGRKGAKSRSSRLSPEERSRIAKKAAAARWARR